MSTRDFLIAFVMLMVGLITGLAIGPTSNSGPLEKFSTVMSGFYLDPDKKSQWFKREYIMDGPEIAQAIILEKRFMETRLVGVEYLISENRYKKLLPEDQSSWHKNIYDYKNGLMAAHKSADDLCQKYSQWYSKIIITWRPSDNYPAKPFEALGFDDTEVKSELVLKRDREMNVNTANLRKDREKLLGKIK